MSSGERSSLRGSSGSASPGESSSLHDSSGCGRSTLPTVQSPGESSSPQGFLEVCHLERATLYRVLLDVSPGEGSTLQGVFFPLEVCHLGRATLSRVVLEVSSGECCRVLLDVSWGEQLLTGFFWRCLLTHGY